MERATFKLEMERANGQSWNICLCCTGSECDSERLPVVILTKSKIQIQERHKTIDILRLIFLRWSLTDVSPHHDDDERTKKNDDHWECKGSQSIHNPVQPRVNQAEEGWLKNYQIHDTIFFAFCMSRYFCLVSKPRRMSYPNFWIDAHIWFFWTKRSHYLTGIWRSRQICKLNFTNSESTDLYVCWLCPKPKNSYWILVS